MHTAGVHLKLPNIYSKILYMYGGALASLRASLEEVSPEVLDGGALNCVVQAISVSDCSLEEGISIHFVVVLSIESLSTSSAVTGPRRHLSRSMSTKLCCILNNIDSLLFLCRSSNDVRFSFLNMLVTHPGVWWCTPW